MGMMLSISLPLSAREIIKWVKEERGLKNMGNETLKELKRALRMKNEITKALMDRGYSPEKARQIVDEWYS